MTSQADNQVKPSARTERGAPVRLHGVVSPRPIAWSSKSRSNGLVYQWSRWHLTDTLADGSKTLCGIIIPKAIWVTRKPDYRIHGGDCLECKKRANAEVSEGGTRDSRIETAAQSRPSLH